MSINLLPATSVCQGWGWADVVGNLNGECWTRMTGGNEANTSANSFGDIEMEILVQVAVQLLIAWLLSGNGGDSGGCAA
jgi:hypothetical protein